MLQRRRTLQAFPEQFGDPLALRTSWLPADPYGGNVSRLVEAGPGRIEFHASGVTRLGCAALGAAGIALFVLAMRAHAVNPGDAPFAFAAFGALLAAASGAYAWFGMGPRIFDRTEGLFWKGRRSPQAGAVDGRASCRLASIHALQILCERTADRGGRRSYELNLVLKDAQRINVVDRPDLAGVRADAARLAAFLNCKVWDSTLTLDALEPLLAPLNRGAMLLIATCLTTFVATAGSSIFPVSLWWLYVVAAVTFGLGLRNLLRLWRMPPLPAPDGLPREQAPRFEHAQEQSKLFGAFVLFIAVIAIVVVIAVVGPFLRQSHRRHTPPAPAKPATAAARSAPPKLQAAPPPTIVATLTDGSFEDGEPEAAGWQLRSTWQLEEGRSTEQARTGRYSLRLRSTRPVGESPWPGWNSSVRYAVGPGNTYAFRVHARTADAGAAAVGMKFYDAAGRSLGGASCPCKGVLPRDRWQPLQFTFSEALQPGVATIELQMMQCPMPADGAPSIVYFDDASLARMPATPAGAGCADVPPE